MTSKKSFLISLVFLMLFLFIPNLKVEAIYCYQKTKNLYLDRGKVVDVFNVNNNGVYLTDTDIDLMAKVVYGESRGEPYEGKVAVASVILNRVKDPSFPNTIEGVIKEDLAFSCVINGNIDCEPCEDCYAAVYEAVVCKQPFISAKYFYNPEIATCDWMKNVKKNNITTIGNHVFFNTD